LENAFDQRRVDEVERLLAGAHQAEVLFGGLLDTVDGEAWSVAGIRVSVPAEAEIVGTPFPGLYVEVAGTSQPDGTVRATRVEVTGLAFIGTVRALGPTAWVVDNTRLIVNTETAVSGAPQVGDLVSVTARRLPDGGWLALRIAHEPEAPPTPAATRTPAPSSTTAATRRPPPAAVEVRFTGVVEAIGPQSWQVGGRVVGLNAATEIRDNPQLGQTVEVRALRAADGTLTALRIEPEDSGSDGESTPAPGGGPAPTPDGDDGEDDSGSSGGPGPSASNTPEPESDGSGEGQGGGQEQRWQGPLEAINGSTWLIAGQAVNVDANTEVRDNPQVGDQVEVRAERQADGSLLALRIEKQD
jgi:hypothetical protein